MARSVHLVSALLVSAASLLAGCFSAEPVDAPAELGVAELALSDRSCDGLREAQSQVCPTDRPACARIEELLVRHGCEPVEPPACLCPEGATLYFNDIGGLYCAVPEAPGGRLSFLTYSGEARCEAFAGSPPASYDISECSECCDALFPATVYTSTGPIQVAS